MMRGNSSGVCVGAHVQFESDHGIQMGKVAEIKADVSNGRRVAAIEVAGSLDGQPWHVPVDQLLPASHAA